MVKYACGICERLYDNLARAEVCESFGVMPTIQAGTLFGLNEARQQTGLVRQAILLLDPYKDSRKDHHSYYWGCRFVLKGEDREIKEMHKHFSKVFIAGFEIPHFDELSNDEFIQASDYFLNPDRARRLNLKSIRRGTIVETNPKNIPVDSFLGAGLGAQQ